MRVAIIAGVIALAATPALSSPSCMTQSEARTKFPTSHLWWHGPDRCWDATPSRRQLGKRIEAKKQAEVQSEPRVEREAPEPKKPVGAGTEHRWRDAMSRMRPEDFAGSVGPARAEASADPAGVPAAPRMNFFERWVEIAQHAPPITNRTTAADLAADARAAEPIVTPVRVMLALLILVLALGAIELMRRPIRRAY